MFKLTSIKSVITLELFFIIGFSSMGNAETTVSAEVQYIHDIVTSSMILTFSFFPEDEIKSRIRGHKLKLSMRL